MMHGRTEGEGLERGGDAEETAEVGERAFEVVEGKGGDRGGAGLGNGGRLEDLLSYEGGEGGWGDKQECPIVARCECQRQLDSVIGDVLRGGECS